MDQLEQILQIMCHVHGPRSVFLGEKDGQYFFLLPKDERSASLEGVQLSGVENKANCRVREVWRGDPLRRMKPAMRRGRCWC